MKFIGEHSNILFIHYGGNMLRGSEMCLINLLKGLNRRKYFPIVICNAQIMYEALRTIGVQTYLLPIPEITIDGRYSKFQIISYIRTLLYVKKIVSDSAIRIIYANSGLPSQIAYPLSCYFKIPILTHLHAPHPRRYGWMWLFKFSTKVIFVSNYIKNELERKISFNGTTKVVYNGVDTKIFIPSHSSSNTLRHSIGYTDTDIVLGYVGGLVSWKRIDMLINAFVKLRKQYPNLKLLIIGEGKQKNELIFLTETLGHADSIMFLGSVKNPQDYFSQVININVLPSVGEAFGLVLVEASACGIPNVATDDCGIPEVLINGETGFLFKKDNMNDLIDKLSLLIGDSDLRKVMGEKGRERVENLFTIQAYVGNIEKEIDELIN